MHWVSRKNKYNLISPAKLRPNLPRTGALTSGILIEARQFLGRVDAQSGELTSEHLLLGLTRLEESRLAELGVTAERIERLLAPAVDTSVIPVTEEFQLEADQAVPRKIRSQPATDTESQVEVQSLDSLTDVFRIIDAAANRAREGLRVVEDVVRFSLSDRFLTEQLKSCRHELAASLSGCDLLQRVRARDTRSDAGTTITLPTEQQRVSRLSVVQANIKRVQEALRTLEEMLKVAANPAAAAKIEQLRYSSYTLEKAIVTSMEANRIFAERYLYLLITESVCKRGWKDVVKQAIDGGVDVIQLREKSLTDGEIQKRGTWLRKQTEAADVLFIMNDRPDLAAVTGADGVHVGQGEASVQAARRTMGPGAIVGVSTHDLGQARKAVLDGADYLGVGPVFPTRTKAFDEYAGLTYVTQIAREISLPWFAIGGINQQNTTSLKGSGASRIAVTAAICGTDRVRETSKLMRTACKK